MFEVLALFFSWLPPPLDTLVVGAFAVLLVLTIIRLIIAIIDMLPFS